MNEIKLGKRGVELQLGPLEEHRYGQEIRDALANRATSRIQHERVDDLSSNFDKIVFVESRKAGTWQAAPDPENKTFYIEVNPNTRLTGTASAGALKQAFGIDAVTIELSGGSVLSHELDHETKTVNELSAAARDNYISENPAAFARLVEFVGNESFARQAINYGFEEPIAVARKWLPACGQ
ncbi:hypothetical protein KX928_06050 [Roseobacter sp. YSTF-M11]|uniref:Uncharacterized protein n=1 Tax=Roseobacter insulae TaxID=2859783 RepID=A0A9X1FTX4_9RHOB|nr:hypothetical protein [Roseobacter insulae]MBW4707344.1 hypothetical protein [Roseobacter insulae]